MNMISRLLLFPFSFFYWVGATVRNFMYDKKAIKSHQFDLPIINVGNLSVGGTGKSPHTMYLIQLLKKQYMVCTLSRGYGRKTKGFKIANYDSVVEDIGDEPLQFFKRYKNKILIAVCEDRVAGVNKLMERFRPDVILLDDAFQHRRIISGLSILLTDYSKLYSEDYLLPAGRLREPRKGADRADVVIVTKCPNDLSEGKSKYIYNDLKIKPHQELFFSKIIYGEAVIGLEEDIAITEWMNINIILVTGIANSNDILAYTQKHFGAVWHLEYKDHYNFTSSDVEYIDKCYQGTEGRKIILTTEKDYMRLYDKVELIENLYYLPIELELNQPEKFNQLILEYVRKNKRSS